MTSPIRVLFVCVRNTARSQMLEALLDSMGEGRFEAESAGLEAGEAVNPLVIEVLREIGIDISGKKPKTAFDLFTQGKKFTYVIAVCDASAAQRCPIFPMVRETLHWPFPDPAAFEGTPEERLAKTRALRDEMREKLRAWIESVAE